MLTKEISEVLKAASTATSVSGLSTLLLNSLGELVKTGAMRIDLTQKTVNLNDVRDLCIIHVSSTSENMPFATTLGIISIPIGSNCYQLALRAGDGGLLYFRALSTMNGWQDWRQVVFA